MMNDEDFATLLPDPRDGWKEFKGAPAKAIVMTAMIRAIQGEKESREWLAKYGYGTKVELTGADGAPLMPIALDSAVLSRMQDGASTPSPEADSKQ